MPNACCRPIIIIMMYILVEDDIVVLASDLQQASDCKEIVLQVQRSQLRNEVHGKQIAVGLQEL